MASVIALGRRWLIEINIERITHDAMENRIKNVLKIFTTFGNNIGAQMKIARYIKS